MAKDGKDAARGQIKTISLKRSIVLNGNVIKKAVVEIDHINYGIDKKTMSLNKKRRSSFTLGDIEKFIMMLDGEYIYPKSHKGRISRYETRIDCPVSGRFQDKQFIMVFELDYDNSDEIYTVTLFPGW